MIITKHKYKMIIDTHKDTYYKINVKMGYLNILASLIKFILLIKSEQININFFLAYKFTFFKVNWEMRF